MAERIIVFWRDIPAQVTVQAGRKRARRELSKRFIEAIDMAAMRVGARDSDAYLAEWRRSEPVPCGDDLEAEADSALSELERAYDDARLKMLVAAGGRES
ncbi:MAG: virulence factor [Rhodobiaceae bacterium]|nr:virulence factor [Rhodobiaceae bacterium]MCC0056404.1 virulence factor [Rhodobiaceae bacterium]